MDFSSILHYAQENSRSSKNEEGRYYSTKFSPPKKENKKSKLSENVQKFLAKKEAEDRERERAARQRRAELIARRDPKDQRKINKMFKTIKSANKSVIEDAIDRENTAVTIEGPQQPDEDDYGYVSQESSKLYKQLMEKYNASDSTNNRSKHNSNSVKKNSHAVSSSKSLTTVTQRQSRIEPSIKSNQSPAPREEQKAQPKKTAPPPLNFGELLKIAAQKQHEPVHVVTEEKKDIERPLTSKEKKEIQEREARELRKKQLAMVQKNATISCSKPQNRPINSIGNGKNPTPGRIPKLQSSTVTNVKNVTNGVKLKSENPDRTKVSSYSKGKYNNSLPNRSEQSALSSNRNDTKSSTNSSSLSIGKKFSESRVGERQTYPIKNSNSSKITISSDKNSIDLKHKSSLSGANSNRTQANGKPLKPSISDIKPRQFPPADVKSKKIVSSTNIKSRPFPPNDVKPRQFPPADIKTRQFPPTDIKTRQFPPPDVRKSNIKKRPIKRRIEDDDDYDSEMDDFIDDGPEEGADYSKYIKQIFGYDKSRYRDYDDDIDNMESTYAQQMKEEFYSKKMGILEDLEDMRMEAAMKSKKPRKG